MGAIRRRILRIVPLATLAISALAATQALGLKPLEEKIPHQTVPTFEGRPVAISGDRLIAGGDASAAIYRREAGGWVLETTLTDAGGSTEFGAAVALQGDLAAVGDPGDTRGSCRGSVSVFHRDASGWAREGDLLTGNCNPPEVGGFGASVAISRDPNFGYSILLVGDPLFGNSTWPEVGKAVFYGRFRDLYGQWTWIFEYQITPGDFPAAGRFGSAVALEGEVAVVAAPGDDDNGPDAGAAYVFRLGAGWYEEGKLLPASGLAGDASLDLGLSVAVSGDVAVLGVPGHRDSPGGDRIGGAFVFTFQVGTSVWVEGPTLLPAPGENFGASVALQNDLMVVGSPGAGTQFEGAAYVFRNGGSGWSQEEKLTASDAATNSLLGFAVDLDGGSVVADAPFHDPEGTTAGATYVFDVSLLLPPSKLVASDGQNNDRFARSVAAGGDVIVVGAPEDHNASGGNAGAAYVLRWDGSSWNEETKLLADDGRSNDAFGTSVAAAGDVIVVGVPAHDADGDGARYDGAAYVFRWDGSSWDQETKLLADDGRSNDAFGTSVAAAADVIVVGAPGHDADGDGQYDGAAYVFRWDGSSWQPETTLLPSDGVDGSGFGRSVAASADVIVVGAPVFGRAYAFRWSESTSTWDPGQPLPSPGGIEFGASVAVVGDFTVVGAPGHPSGGLAHLFRWNGTIWYLDQPLTRSGAQPTDEFGRSVSATDDAIVVGDPLDDNGNGVDAGAAYLFRWNGSNWGGATVLLADDGVAADQFGRSVASTGDLAVVGAELGDGSQPNSGAAYVYGTPLAACSDGIDNDGDSLVDLADPGCTDADDRWEREAEEVPVSGGSSVPASALGGAAVSGGVDAGFDTTGGGTLRAEVASLVTQAGQDPGSLFVDPTTIDFYVMGSPAQLWELSYTEDPLPGEVEITFGYDESVLTGPESSVVVYHFVDPDWVAISPLPGDLDTVNNTVTIRTTSLSPFLLGVARACGDGIDNDGDGATDGADPDCLDGSDPSELPACSDGLDDDYDGWIDYPADPGCQAATSRREAPQCQDGVGNDNDGLVDYDGGQSIHGACADGQCPTGVSDPDGDGVADHDPQCVDKPWKNKEKKNSGGCGLGIELALLLPPLMWFSRRRRS